MNDYINIRYLIRRLLQGQLKPDMDLLQVNKSVFFVFKQVKTVIDIRCFNKKKGQFQCTCTQKM